MSQQNSDTPPQLKPAANKTKRFVAIAIIGGAAYYLSIGPALYLMRREHLPEKFVRSAYRPLALFDEWRPNVLYQRWWYCTKEEREAITAEETWTAAQWLKHAMQQLKERGDPAAELIRSPQQKEWADNGFIRFTDGWAAFASHSSHDSDRIGDIGLLLTSEGAFYTNHFHFCMGESEYHGPKQTQPKDFSAFLERYGAEQRWKRQP